MIRVQPHPFWDLNFTLKIKLHFISHEVKIFEVRYVESVSVNSPQSDGSTLYGLSIPFGSKIGLIIFMMEIDESLLEKCM